MKKYISLILMIILVGIIISLIVILIDLSRSKSTLSNEIATHKNILTEKDTIISEQISKLDMLEKSKQQLNIEFEKINEEYEMLHKTYMLKVSDYEDLNSVNQDISEKINKANDFSFIQSYGGQKYPVESGIRRIIEDNPLRIYPSSQAPYVYGDYIPYIVEVINEVASRGESWCHVIDFNGVSGYIQSDDMAKIDKSEEYHIMSSESLGGFRVGERIECIIGKLDRDYYLVYENGRIYIFPDSQQVTVDNPIDRPFTDIKNLDAFVNNTNHITFLRTDSPEYQLESGYKVGDNAIEVLNHYESKYELDDKKEGVAWYYGYDFSYVTEDGILMFRIDSEQLDNTSIITSIVISYDR